MTSQEWHDAILAERARATSPLSAMAYFGRKANSTGKPRLLLCSDGNEYWVKDAVAGKDLVSEQLVSACGQLIDAPVPGCKLVELPRDLIESQNELSHLTQAVYHGSRHIPATYEIPRLIAVSEPANRARFASIAVLFGWMGREKYAAWDLQFLYRQTPPNLVFSVDHGDFFPGSMYWTSSTLKNAQPARPDERIVRECKLTVKELSAAISPLSNATDDKIVSAVALPPADWPILDCERVAMAEYLSERRESLLNRLL